MELSLNDLGFVPRLLIHCKKSLFTHFRVILVRHWLVASGTSSKHSVRQENVWKDIKSTWDNQQLLGEGVERDFFGAKQTTFGSLRDANMIYFI